MRNLIQLFVKYNFVVLFIILEIVCFRLIVKYNTYQRSKIFSSSNVLIGNLYTKVSKITNYLSLAKENDELNKENARLRNLLFQSNKELVGNVLVYTDTIINLQYVYSPAKIINNSVNKQLNFITLNKGSSDGVEPGFGVISDKGVIGVIKDVSKNYSTAYSLLNNRIRVSAKIMKNNYYGSLTWDGRSYKNIKLNDIPYHADVNVGDTIVTSGFSSTFPENIILGEVLKIESSTGGTFHDITVKLSVDFKQVSYVNIVHNLNKQEQKILEQK